MVGYLFAARLFELSCLLQSFDAKKEVTCAIFDRSENRISIGTSAGSIKQWELESAKALATMPSAHRSSVTALEYHPANDALLASGGADGLVKLWNSHVGGEYSKYAAHAAPITCLRFLQRGRALAAGAADGRIVVFDLSSGNILGDTGNGGFSHRGGCCFIETHPTDTSVFVSGGYDHVVSLASSGFAAAV